MPDSTNGGNGVKRAGAIVVLISFLLGVGGSLIAVGASQGSRDARIVAAETKADKAVQAQAADHDVLVEMRTIVGGMAKQLDKIDRRIDEAIGRPAGK